MFVSVSVFASNLTERNVYGILTDNYTGATFYNSLSQDNIGVWAGSSYGAWRAVSAVHVTSAPANAKEGMNYWEIVMDNKWNSVTPESPEFPQYYWTSVTFPFVTAASTDKGYDEQSTDISHFKYLDFWVKPVRGDVDVVLVGIKDYLGENCVSLGSLGVSKNNNNWQHVVLDLTTLSGANLHRVYSSFLMKTENNQLTQNTVFYVDNVVLRTDSSSASFNVTLKKNEYEQWPGIPENPTQITWDDESVFAGRKWEPWVACGQYVELDMDTYASQWTVRLYTNNGAPEGNLKRNGMYATAKGKDYIVPLCWRAYNGTLTNQSGDTYIIGQDSDYNLYDSGSGNTEYFPWFYVKDFTDVDFNNPEDVDYITVWDSSLGYHGASEGFHKGYYGFMKKNGQYDEHGNPIYVPTVEKKPKVYLGGGFANAAGGVTYVGNIVFELNYE